MSDRVCVPIIPRDSYSAPIRSNNCALIGGTRFPANAVASFEKSGLVAGHITIQERGQLPCLSVTTLGKVLPEYALAKARGQTTERKIWYQDQQQ
jgi:hypothetical protein